jgi:hypothetical protein
MKNFKKIILIVIIAIPLAGAQRPPQPPKLPTFGQSIEQTSYFDRLPADLQNELLQYTLKGSGGLNIPAMANLIIAMRNRITPEKLIEIFESLPTNAAALSLAEQLKNLPVTQSEKVKNWLQRAGRFVNGQRLYNAVASLADLPLLERLLRNRYIDLNWAGGPFPSPTPLMNAISLGNTQGAAILIRAGANLNLRNSEGDTALTEAVNKHNKTIINMLINSGAQVNLQSKCGWTALASALAVRDLEITTSLLKAGANPNLQDKWGKSALGRSLMYAGGRLVEILLVEYGANPNLQDNDGETALMQAAWLGDIDVVEFFLAHGADPNVRNKRGQTASDLAREHIQEGHFHYERNEHDRERYRQIVEILDAASAARPKKEEPAERCVIQ